MADIIRELQKINNFENRLRRVKLTQDTNFNVDVDGKISFNIDGKSYGAPQSRPLIHQLGSRMWQESDEYKSVYQRWNAEYSNNKLSLVNNIIEKLKESSSILLLDDRSKKLYGIISEHFTQIDPLDFRNKFLEEYGGMGLPLKNESKFERTPFGELIEKYSFDESSLKHSKEKIDYGLHIIYGLNNGYSSFRVRLGRTIVICTNGLKAFEGITAKLKHVRNADISAFVKDVKENILEYNNKFQETIESAKNRKVQPGQLNELFQRLHLATVVKNRIKDRFEDEKTDYGDNEWTLSQSFTHLSTHFYKAGSDRYHQRILTEVGSDILDGSVESVLDQKVKQNYFGELQTFGNLLPKVLPCNCC
jgi:hypothetical protein